MQSPDGKPRLNHVAFEVREIHEVFGGDIKAGWGSRPGGDIGGGCPDFRC